MANVSNPGLLTSLREQKTAQSRFNEAARAASSGSMTKANPAASPAAFVNAESQKLGLKVKEQASKNASQGLAYLEMANAGVSSIKDIFEEVQSLATANANGATSVSQRKINAQQMAAKVAQIASVNKTASLNPGQPVTAGSCRVIGKSSAAASGIANYNPELGNVAAKAGTATGVSVLSKATADSTGAVTLSYYSGGTSATATYDTTGTAKSVAIGDNALSITALGIEKTDSSDEAVAKANKFLKQGNASAEDRFNDRNLVSMATTGTDYNPDDRVKSNTVTSAQYDGMYGVLSSTGLVNTETGSYSNSFTIDVTSAKSSLTETLTLDTSAQTVKLDSYSVEIGGINFTLDLNFSGGTTNGSTPTIQSGTITAATFGTDNVSVLDQLPKKDLVAADFGTVTASAIAAGASSMTAFQFANSMNITANVSFDVKGDESELKATSDQSANKLENGTLSGIAFSNVVNPFEATIAFSSGADFGTSTAPTVTIAGPTGITFSNPSTPSYTLTKPSKNVTFTLDTGLEVLTGAIDTSKPLPERIKLTNSAIQPNQDSSFSGASLAGTNPNVQSDVELNLVSLGNNLTTAISNTVIQFGREELTTRFQDTDNSGASTSVKLDALTARSLGLDSVDISSQEAAEASMDILESIKVKLLDNLATVAKAQGEVETAKSQIETNIIATNKVLETIDGVDSLEIAQIMSQEKQKIQQTIAIMTSQSEQQSAISQGAQQLMRG